MHEEEGGIPRNAPGGMAGWWVPAALLLYAAAGLAWVAGAEALLPAGSVLRAALQAAFVLAPAGCGVWALR
ncbi:GGDEF domain-containing protein, partial [Paracidovorax avenae]